MVGAFAQEAGNTATFAPQGAAPMSNAGTPASPQPGAAARAHADIEKVMRSPDMDDMARRAQAANSRAIESVSGAGPNEGISRRVGQSAASIKFGRHVVVSKDGADSIDLLLQMAAAKLDARQEMLRRLVDASNDGQPEAQTVLGWLSEMGIYGVPQDQAKAVRMYQAAAQQRYQPAMYNLALVQAYGKTGAPRNEADALARLIDAASIGSEPSHRVCSMGAFISWRARRPDDAQRFVTGCNTPLGQLPVAAWSTSMSLPERLRIARDSLATGVDDGIAVAVAVARPTATSDQQQSFCTWRLVQLWDQVRSMLKDASKACFLQVQGRPDDSVLSAAEASMVAGIGAGASLIRDSIPKARASHRFRHSMSVPFLPFGQAALDVFAKELQQAQKKDL